MGNHSEKTKNDKIRNSVLSLDTWTRGDCFFSCDECFQSIPPEGPRYYCWTCDDDQVSYDLCEECNLKGHPHPTKKGKGSFVAGNRNFTSCAEKMQNVFERNSSFKFIGEREILSPDKNLQAKYGAYHWISYSDVYEMSAAFGAVLQKMFKKGNFIGVCGINCTNWYVTDYALIMGGFVSVPIHWVFDVDAIEHIIKQTKLKCVVVKNQQIPKFIEAKKRGNCPTFKYIITMDLTEPDLDSQCKDTGINLLNMNDLILKGKELQFLLVKRNSTDILTLTYTSGSTGLPKGTIIQDVNVQSEISKPLLAGNVVVSLSFGPLAHGTQRNSSFKVFGSGGRIGIFSGDMSHIFDDIKELRPTILALPPRICNKLYTDFQQSLSLATLNHPPEEHPNIEKNIRNQFCEAMGNRLWNLTTGGAPCNPEVVQFLRNTYNCSVDESYGTTETGPVAINGIKVAHIEVKLKDVPELGYFQTDEPLPRGELWVKSPFAAPSYFNDAKNTSQNFEDEWVSTGDIVEYDNQTGRINILDRKKNIFKLSQGEYVTPEKLELIFIKSHFVLNCFIYGNSLKAFVLAVVVPNEKTIHEWVESSDLTELKSLTLPELCAHPLVKQTILDSMKKLGTDLRPYEIPHDIHIEPDPFSPENRLLTPSFKLNRPNLNLRYKSILENMYSNIETTMITKDFKNRILTIICDTLGIKEEGDLLGSTLEEIGLDSISAVKLTSVAKKQLEIKIPMELLFRKDMTMAEMVETLARRVSLPPEQVDWTKETELKIENFENEKIIPYNSENPVRAIFLTGATGLIGAFLLQHLLETTTATVYCLVRTRVGCTAWARLKEALVHFILWTRVKGYKDRIIPVSGCLSLPLLGIPLDMFEDIGKSVDVIYNSGAQVNGILPYSVLRGPNVQGFQSLLHLTFIHHLKPIYHISTLSVLSQFKEKTEDTQLELSELDYLGSYGASKCVAEILLQKASEKYGLPWVIFRPGTITGDTVNGASNTGQFINRYMGGIIQMGYAPDINSQFDMLPVDHLVKQICHLASPSNFGKVFHLFNKEKSLTINQISNYVRTFGYDIKVIPFSSWKTFLTDLSLKGETKNELFPLISYFSGGFPQFGNYKDLETRKLLSDENLPPQITEKIIHLYLKFFVDHKIIKPPSE